MKHLLLVILLLVADTLYAQQPPNRHALIIAIGNYPPNGWALLNTANDTTLIRTVLQRQSFRSADISILVNQKATIEGIDSAFGQLIKTVTPGDVVFVAFSSHGEQVEDDNRDETDCLDESIVTYNAILPENADKKDYPKNQSQFLRDDKIGEYLRRLRKKAGKDGDVVFFIDACHSGTGARFKSGVRGDQPPLVSATFKECSGNTTDTTLIVDGPQRNNDANMASFAVFSASRAEEVAVEVENGDAEKVGPLTFAMCSALSTLGTAVTYGSFFSIIESNIQSINPGQHPVFEGNSENRLLWGGRYVPKPTSFEIAQVLEPDKILVKGGALAGLDSGALVSLYPYNTVDTTAGQLIQRGRVVKADLYQSIVQLYGKNNNGNMQGWIFLSTPVFSQRPVSIRLSGYSRKEAEEIRNTFAGWPLIGFKDSADLILVKGPSRDSLVIAATGMCFGTIVPAVAHKDSLKAIVNRYLQYAFLAGLNITDPIVDPEVKLVRLKNGKIDTASAYNKINGTYQFSKTDAILVWVKNHSTVPIYINLIALQPDGVIAPLFPNKQLDNPIYSSDLQIPARGEHIFTEYIIEFDPPFGTQIFKLFASKQMLDLEYLAGFKGLATKSNMPVLEKIFNYSYELGQKNKASLRGQTEGVIQSIMLNIKD